MAYYPPIQFENFLRALENLGSSRVSSWGQWLAHHLSVLKKGINPH